MFRKKIWAMPATLLAVEVPEPPAAKARACGLATVVQAAAGVARKDRHPKRMRRG